MPVALGLLISCVFGPARVSTNVSSMGDWVKESSTDKLRQIRATRASSSPEHRVADEEIRRREAEEAKNQSQRQENREEERHHDHLGQREEQLGALQTGFDSLVSGQGRLERHLRQIHRVDLWILLVGVIAALAGVVLLALEILHIVRAGI